MIRIPMSVALMGLVTLAACNKDDTGTDTGDSAAQCTNSISEQFPTQNATNAYYRTTIEVKLAVEEADATLSVADSSGADVAGSLEVNGKRLIFTPNAPLAPSTAYTVTVSYSCGDASYSFTTSEVGAETDSASLEGGVYNLDLASGRFVKPEGVGALLRDYLDVAILVKVTGVNGSDIEMIGAVADPAGNPPTQEACDPTIPFPVADFSANPYFEVGPQATAISVSGYTVTIDDLFVSGSFSPDADYIAGAVLKGSIDTRPLVPLLSPDGDDNAICDIAVTVGVTCEDCGNGDVYCLSLHVDNIDAAGVTSTVVALHEPTNSNPPEGSTNYCENAECSAEPECAAR